ncbi:NAD(+) synthase [Egibacter rhizosphaerae]|uniref:Glutamine-dependent NAD(+) synthetase n=1 Tax=Egibacter rhizosphaerae TaxID=1670831 RepID=A0A411YJW3_9ACTN|nr:NAD(+) synthase [Egibacter rhizosphaerae]QBI21477.1 NAD(+) synthase [Egibacter rhizosphaerae]
MTTSLRVAVAQLPNRVGDLDGNAERIGRAMDWAEQEAEADVLVLPELVLTGYGLGDLVLHREFLDDADDALRELTQRSGRTTTVLSTVERVAPQRSWDTRERSVAISAALISGGELRGSYHKMLLPMYDLFDEARNFAPGRRADQLWRIGDVAAGVSICEDLWSPEGPPEAQSVAGAQILLVPNSSPFHRGKAVGRLTNTQAVAVRNGLPVVYVNFVGGQDEVVFDGGSIVVDRDGELRHRGREFAVDHFAVDVPLAPERPLRGPITTVHTRPIARTGPVTPTAVPREPLQDPEATWSALTSGLRDYAERNDFHGIALGLSGGIDAGVTATLAVDAVGPDRVLALALPSPETPGEETTDAKQLAANLGIALEVVSVEVPSRAEEVPEGAQEHEAHGSRYEREHAYHRARAAVLLDMFEERQYLVLATGNKSEISVGEASLFGSLAGEFAPLKDCPKTLVYELARWRNARGGVIPEQTLARTSTMRRLSPDPLPSYEVLDDIVQRYVEYQQGFDDLVAAGYAEDVVQDALRRIDDAERIRRYTPIGVKVTSRAFNQDRRMPMTSGWRAHPRPEPIEDPWASAAEQAGEDVPAPGADGEADVG